jgi:ABC-2 type transport system permease protein
MSKLKIIIKREFLAKVRNRTFIVMTILSPLLIVGLMMLVIFLSKQNSENIRTIAVVDESGLLTGVFEDTSETKYVDLTNLGKEEAKKKVENSYDGLIYIGKIENLNQLSKRIEYFSNDTPSVVLLQSIENKLEREIRNLKIAELQFDLQKLKETETTVSLTTENFAGKKSSKIGSILTMVAGGGFGYLIFMFIIIYGASVMRSVIEEKTSRIIEVIISSVKPFQLMMGKILGNAFAGILQFIIWIISAGILLVIISAVFGVDVADSSSGLSQMNPQMLGEVQNSSGDNIQLVLQEIANLPWGTIIFSFVIFFFGGYLVYSSIYAAIGAAVDSETDSQQFMLPVILPLMIAIYIGFSVLENPHGPIAFWFSLFPLTSPIVMLMRIPFVVPTWQIILSMALLLVTFLGIVWFAAKIYRIGILSYGKKPTYKELFRWLKY